MDTLEDVVRELLQEHGVGFKTNSKSFIMTCPRCRKKEKLYIRRYDGRFVCWYCAEIENFQGQPEFALRELTGRGLEELRKKLYGEAEGTGRVDLRLRGVDFSDEDLIDIPPPLKTYSWPIDFYQLDTPEAQPGVDYLSRRGIPRDVAMAYGIRYDPQKQRVVFPVLSGGELLGWQSRLTKGDKPYWDDEAQKMVNPLKIITSTDLKRDRCLMFADRLQGSEHCILTEGPVDALKAHLCGGNVASMGKAVSNGQIELIRNSGVRKLYLGLDPDAWLEINRIRKRAADMLVFDLRPPKPFKDLGEMPLEAVRQLFDHAPRLNPAHILLFLKSRFGAD